MHVDENEINGKSNNNMRMLDVVNKNKQNSPFRERITEKKESTHHQSPNTYKTFS